MLVVVEACKAVRPQEENPHGDGQTGSTDTPKPQMRWLETPIQPLRRNRVPTGEEKDQKATHHTYVANDKEIDGSRKRKRAFGPPKPRARMLVAVSPLAGTDVSTDVRPYFEPNNPREAPFITCRKQIHYPPAHRTRQEFRVIGPEKLSLASRISPLFSVRRKTTFSSHRHT